MPPPNAPLSHLFKKKKQTKKTHPQHLLTNDLLIFTSSWQTLWILKAN